MAAGRHPGRVLGVVAIAPNAATLTPRLPVPVGNHFEQNIHVRHRLTRHGAGHCLEYRDADPDRLAAVIAEEIDRPVPTSGARRAAALLAELL